MKCSPQKAIDLLKIILLVEEKASTVRSSKDLRGRVSSDQLSDTQLCFTGKKYLELSKKFEEICDAKKFSRRVCFNKTS